MAAQHFERRGVEHVRECRAGAKSQVLGDVREHEPRFTRVREMLRQAGEEGAQHPVLRVVDRTFEDRARASRYPRRVAHDERSAARRKEVRLQDFDFVLEAESRDPAHHALTQALGFSAEMVIPLIARDRTWGTLTLVCGDGSNRSPSGEVWRFSIAWSAASTPNRRAAFSRAI